MEIIKDALVTNTPEIATLLTDSAPTSLYRDQKYTGEKEQLERDLQTSTTLYVGNLSFFTTEEQIYELFSKCGEIKRIIMGLNKESRTPCGFCFVEYYTREDAEDCVKWINGVVLDDRIIRTDWDAGFKEGRQYGRGKSGGQVRDEFRTDNDPGRGGLGKLAQLQQQNQEFNPNKKRYNNRNNFNSYHHNNKRMKMDEEDQNQRNSRFREHSSDDEFN